MRLPRVRTDHRDESGAIAVMAAVMVVVVLLAASLAVDVGRVAYTSRDLQGVTDRAALDALTLLAADHGATTLADLHSEVEQEIGASLERNPGTAGRTADERTVDLVGLGRVQDGIFEAMCEETYDVGAAASCTGDVDGDGTAEWTVDDVTAVRVGTETAMSFVFALGASERTIVREAVAETEEVAAISVGSRLAELDLNNAVVGGVLDALLGEMLLTAGVTSWPTLTAVGYDGLATTTIPLGHIADLDADVLSPRSVVPNVDVELAGLLEVMASAFVDGDPSAQFLSDLADGVAAADASAGLPFTVDIGQLLWVTTEEEETAADADVNLWDLLIGSLQVANLDNGLTLSTDVLPESGGWLLGITDLLEAEVTATIVEAPRMAIGPVRSVPRDIDGDGIDEDWWVTEARTAQVRVDVQLGVGEDPEQVFGPHADSLLGGLLTGLLDLIGDLLCLLCPDEAAPVSITVEGAAARAGLSGIGCTDPSVTTEVLRRPLDTGLFEVDGDTRSFYLGLDDVLEAEAEAEVTTPSLEPSGEVEEVVVNPVPDGATVGHGTPLTIPVLDALLEPLFAMLGLDLGTATVWGHWVDCESRQLAHIAG